MVSSLHKAINDRVSLREFRTMLKTSPDAITSKPSKNKPSPILLACKNIETLSYAKLMVEHYPISNKENIKQYNAALYSLLDLKPLSSQQHHLQHEIISLLLESNFNPTAFDYLNRAENNYLSQDIMSKLYEKGCVPSITGSCRSTVVTYNVTAPYRMKAFISNATRNPAGQTPLQLLMERSDNKINHKILELLRYGADHKEFSPKPLIHILIENMNDLTLSAVKILINRPNFDINVLNEENENVLQVLAKNLNKQSIEIFCTLIRAGANVKLLDKNLEAELLHSIIDYSGKITRTNKTLPVSMYNDAKCKYSDRLPRYARKALLILKEHGFDLNCKNKDGLNLLQKIMNDEPEFFSIDAALFLIDHGVSPSVFVMRNKTVMHCYADSKPVLFYSYEDVELSQHKLHSVEDQKLFSQNFELLIEACAKANPEDNIMLKRSPNEGSRTAAEYFVNRHLGTSSRFDNARVKGLVYLHIYQLIETKQYPAKNILENFRTALQIVENQKKDKTIFRDIAASAIVDYVTKIKDESPHSENSEQQITHCKELLEFAINQTLFNEHGWKGELFTKVNLRPNTGCKKTFSELLVIMNQLEPIAYTKTTLNDLGYSN